MQTLGIDLGTTNTVAAVAEHVFALSENGQSTLPSVVAFLPNGSVQIGDTARRRRAIDSQNTVYSSKRIIGRRWSDDAVENFRELYPFAMVEQDDWPFFETRAGRHSPSQIGTIILGAVFARARSLPGDYGVNLTVPATFTAPQSEATRLAAERAGFQSVTLVPEPVATALSYLTLPRNATRAVVYDLGGGTFDCAVVECSGEKPKMLAHASDLFLGGDDIDQRLAAWVAQQVLEKHNWDLTNYSEIYDRLLARCEQAKIRLTYEHETVVEVSQIDPECPAAGDGITVQRSLVSELCEDLLRRTFGTCDDVLRMAALRPSDIDSVFLAGGATLLPAVQEGVRDFFGRPGILEFDPTEVVARGACLADAHETWC